MRPKPERLSRFSLIEISSGSSKVNTWLGANILEVLPPEFPHWPLHSVDFPRQEETWEEFWPFQFLIDLDGIITGITILRDNFVDDEEYCETGFVDTEELLTLEWEMWGFRPAAVVEGLADMSKFSYDQAISFFEDNNLEIEYAGAYLGSLHRLIRNENIDIYFHHNAEFSGMDKMHVFPLENRSNFGLDDLIRKD